MSSGIVDSNEIVDGYHFSHANHFVFDNDVMPRESSIDELNRQVELAHDVVASWEVVRAQRVDACVKSCPMETAG